MFDLISPELRQKTNQQKVIATDLARLYAMDAALKKYERVIWLDSDFLVFAPQYFRVPNKEDLPEGYMLGREVWIQEDLKNAESLEKATRKLGNRKIRANVKVHNAFMLFDRGNSFLSFYKEHAERLLSQCEGNIPPQFIGPKLLTALHNVVQCPVLESAGMFSPLIIDDLLSNGKSRCALNLFKKRSKQLVSAANLCSSLQNGNEEKMCYLIDKLVSESVCI